MSEDDTYKALRKWTYEQVCAFCRENGPMNELHKITGWTFPEIRAEGLRRQGLAELIKQL